MDYKIKLDMTLDAGALQTLLQTLNNGPHGLMRSLIDNIVSQAQEQEAAAKAEQAAQPTDVEVEEAVGGTD